MYQAAPDGPFHEEASPAKMYVLPYIGTRSKCFCRRAPNLQKFYELHPKKNLPPISIYSCQKTQKHAKCITLTRDLHCWNTHKIGAHAKCTSLFLPPGSSKLGLVLAVVALSAVLPYAPRTPTTPPAPPLWQRSLPGRCVGTENHRRFRDPPALLPRRRASSLPARFKLFDHFRR